MLPVSALIANAYNKVVPKKDVEKFSFSEINIEKVKSFTQTPIKNFALAFSKLASCLIFRPFLTLDPWQVDCL